MEESSPALLTALACKCIQRTASKKYFPSQETSEIFKDTGKFLQWFIFNTLFRRIAALCFQYNVSLILVDYRGGKKANKLLQGHFVFERRKGARRCNAAAIFPGARINVNSEI